MGTQLSRDPTFCETTFIVIDFEATTPAGVRPEPIDVAAVWLTAADGTPRLATTYFLDTVRLARTAYPDLPSHSLDVVLRHLGISIPAGRRHRARPDVELTSAAFAQVLGDGAAAGRWHRLADLRRIGGYQPKASGYGRRFR